MIKILFIVTCGKHPIDSPGMSFIKKKDYKFIVDINIQEQTMFINGKI